MSHVYPYCNTGCKINLTVQYKDVALLDGVVVMKDPLFSCKEELKIK